MQRTLVLTILLILNVSCATPVPPASSYFRDGAQTHNGLPVDLAILETAKLSQDKKHVARELLTFVRGSKASLREYRDALETNLEANEQVAGRQRTFHEITGPLAGLTAAAVIFSTAAIAAPAFLASCVLASVTIEKLDIDPQIRTARNLLHEIRDLEESVSEVEQALVAMASADSELEATRRLQDVEAHGDALKKKVSDFFTRPVDGG